MFEYPVNSADIGGETLLIECWDKGSLMDRIMGVIPISISDLQVCGLTSFTAQICVDLCSVSLVTSPVYNTEVLTMRSPKVFTMRSPKLLIVYCVQYGEPWEDWHAMLPPPKKGEKVEVSGKKKKDDDEGQDLGRLHLEIKLKKNRSSEVMETLNPKP
jgi:hypothetical protein